MTMLQVAERVSHSTGAAAVVSPALVTTTGGCPPHTRVLSLWDIGQVSKKYKHALVFGGCGFRSRRPLGRKPCKGKTLGLTMAAGGMMGTMLACEGGDTGGDDGGG